MLIHPMTSVIRRFTDFFLVDNQRQPTIKCTVIFLLSNLMFSKQKHLQALFAFILSRPRHVWVPRARGQHGEPGVWVSDFLSFLPSCSFEPPKEMATLVLFLRLRVGVIHRPHSNLSLPFLMLP